jgi:preprotein translocase subunit SecG
MQPIIFIIHVIAAMSLIALILLQHGKGADAGAAFGSGASQTMFGSVGSIPFLTKITAIVAAVFFASSLMLGYFTAKQARQQPGAITVPLTSEQQSLPAKSSPAEQNVPAPATVPATTMPVVPLEEAAVPSPATASTKAATPAKATTAAKAKASRTSKRAQATQ